MSLPSSCMVPLMATTLNHLSNCTLTMSLHWVLKNDPLDDKDSSNDSSNGDLVFSHWSPDSPIPHSTSIKPGFPHTNIDTITTEFKATKFIPALTTFICRVHPPPEMPVLLITLICTRMLQFLYLTYQQLVRRGLFIVFMQLQLFLIVTVPKMDQHILALY